MKSIVIWLKKLFSPHTTINKVEIVVTSNQDPSRIARLTVDELEKLCANCNRRF